MASTDLRQLSSSDLIGRVDGVAERLDADRFEFRSPVGSVTWRRVTGANTEPETNREHGAHAWHYEIEHCEGVNLLGFMARVDESALAASLQQWSGATTTNSAIPHW
jgi:hypothetical protein